MAAKLIAFDMDGTLLNSEKKISEKTLAGVNKALDDGHVAVLATGRSIPEAAEFIEMMPKLRYIICVSGALIMDLKEDKVIYSDAIPVDTVKVILSRIKGRDIMVHLLLKDRSILENEKKCRLADYNLGEFQEPFDRVITGVDSIDEFVDEYNAPIEKLNLHHTSIEEREISRKIFSDMELEIVDSEVSSLEFSSKGVTKGKALTKLSDYLGIPMCNVIAVGDNDNDIAMLKTAGTGVAMGNASDGARAVSDIVVADNDHDGCLKALELLY